MSDEVTSATLEDILALTADIVSAHVSNNRVSTEELPGLIASIHGALSGLNAPAVEPEAPRREPAVSIRASIRPDYIVCLEDGAKLKMLKRYLRTNFDLSPEEYRRKWGLPSDYPMVAPSYAEKRRGLAHAIGLGRKPKAAEAPAPAAETPAAPKRRGRPPKAAAPVETAAPAEAPAPEEAAAPVEAPAEAATPAEAPRQGEAQARQPQDRRQGSAGQGARRRREGLTASGSLDDRRRSAPPRPGGGA